jgi:sugar phosphate isomerase/epimerase
MLKSLNTGAIGVKADLATAARMAKQYGFDGVHVSINEVAALGVAEAKDALAQAGVVAAGFGLPVDCYGPEAKFADALAGLPALCKVACDLGMNRTSTWMPSWHDAMDWDDNWAFMKDRMSRTAAVLADYGIRFGIEFLGPKTLYDGHKYVFIHSMADMLKLCAEIPSGNAGLLLDAFHWWTAGGTWEDLAALRDAEIVDVHVNDAAKGVAPDKQIDNIRFLPGETGVIGIPRFLSTLAKIGYTGPVMVEPFSARVNAMPPDEAVKATGEALNAVWQEAGL